VTTNIKVVDASAVAAVLFDEEEGEGLLPQLANTRLAAPTLLPYEIGNIFLNKTRAAPTLRRDLREMLLTFSDFEIELHVVELEDVVKLAAERRLTAYDASYLWLAHHLEAELITLDKRLLAAWRD
jgi:predicted nucleic acid-binding protein